MTFAGEHVEQHVPLYRLELPARHALTTVMAKAQTRSQGETTGAGGANSSNRSPTTPPVEKKCVSPARGEGDKAKNKGQENDTSLRVVCLSFNLKGQPFADHAGAAGAVAAGMSAANEGVNPSSQAPPLGDGDAYSAVHTCVRVCFALHRRWNTG